MDLVAGLKHGSGSRSAVRNELLQHSKPDLVVLCEDRNLATRGTKKELVKRMMEYHFSPAPTPTAASESLTVNDNDDDDNNDFDLGSRSGLKPVDFAMLPGVDGTEEIEIEDADSEKIKRHGTN